MANWIEITIAGGTLVCGVIAYLIRVETRLSEIKTDLAWIKKVMDSRKTPRKEET